MSAHLTRDQILNCSDLVVEPVATPEWGGQVFVRVMSGSQREEYVLRMRKLQDEKRLSEAVIMLVVLGACDSKGRALFGAVDTEALGRRSSQVLERVAEAVIRLNALTNEAAEALEKNLKGEGSDVSGSPSPAI